MANFYRDNSDIQFLFRHMDLAPLAEVCEEGFRFAGQFEHAPADAAEAIRNYEMVLDSLGQLCAEFIAPRAEGVDREGNVLNEDGTVTRAKGIAEAIEKLGQAEVMGFTLPHRFGGLNFPNLVYSMAIEILSRADAALMNIFGLQGIAETINAFASEEIKEKYLRDFSAGKVTGAMVLTEPDAGSDLQAVKLRAFQDAAGNWFLHGVKRFITNGCGEVLLVLARSEPDEQGGLGLSLFLCERQPAIRVRRIEDKLGIHGSPTCELEFHNALGYLIGERRRGLVTYTMALMNGARVGIAAQSLGIAEAAYREARNYAHSRVQFAKPIEDFPAVRDLLVEMKVLIEASRSLTYDASRVMDYDNILTERIETGLIEKERIPEVKKEQRQYMRLAAFLTPVAKYYASEAAIKVTNDAIQVLGGSGFMRDYPLERHLRDARITPIYEGTSQLQVVAAIRGVTSGVAETYFTELDKDFPKNVEGLAKKLRAARLELKKAVEHAKAKGGDYTDLYARDLVDIAIDILLGYLFLKQAAASKKKLLLARHFIPRAAARIRMLSRRVLSNDVATIKHFEALAGPPTAVA